MTDAEDAVFEGISAPVVARGGADDNIQVLVRVRPLLKHEVDRGEKVERLMPEEEALGEPA